MASQSVWHIIAGEYPPDAGGVSDYTASVVEGLAEAGHQIHVWTRGQSADVVESPKGVFIHRCAGAFDLAALKRLSGLMANYPAPRRLLVQYVPHAFGYKAMNLPFVFWVRARALQHGDDVQLMVHEVAYPWVRSPLRHNMIAAANELMMRVMAKAASRIYVSTDAWRERLIRLGAQPTQLSLLAIPSNIPEAFDYAAIESLRAKLTDGNRERVVIGHFGTYGKNIQNVLLPILERTMALANCHLHLIGGGSEAFLSEMRDRFPTSKVSITATGRLGANEIAQHIRACDLMLQPYADGANTRRTSLMACLINRRATVSTTGPHCEPFWEKEGIIRLAKLLEPLAAVDCVQELIDAPEIRNRLGERAYQYYQQQLSLQHTLSILTATSPTPARRRVK